MRVYLLYEITHNGVDEWECVVGVVSTKQAAFEWTIECVPSEWYRRIYQEWEVKE